MPTENQMKDMKQNSIMGSSATEGEIVCVTGGSGFIGSWLIKLLLERGYVVRATVRDPGWSLYYCFLNTFLSLMIA